MNRLFSLALFPVFFSLVTTLLLGSCGGSGGGSSDGDGETSQDLRVILGNDITISELTEIEIQSFLQGGTEPFVYKWQIQPILYEDALSGDEDPIITFTAPEVLTTTEILLTLSVTDATGISKVQNKSVFVTPISSPPIISLLKAGTVSGSEFTVESGEGFQLEANWIDGEDGTAVKAVQLLLEQTAGAAIDNLPTDGIRRNFTEQEPTVTELIAQQEFVNPSSQPVTLKFTLKVTDTNDISTETELFVDILPISASRPIVSAGSDRVAYEGQVVTLKGASNTSQLEWRQTSGGSVITLENATLENARFIAPAVTETAEYEFALTGTNNIGNKEDRVLVTVLAISPFDGINDTGLTNCADATNNAVPCSLTAFPNQDAEQGRDPAHISDTLSKRGNGELGFDFTRLDANGDEIPSGDAACVRDNVTELIWEVKSTTGFRAYNSTFSWYNPDSATNGASAGFENLGSCTTATGILTNCDTASYVSAVNNVGLCGANDWRLPSIKELMSIFNLARLDDKFARDENLVELWAAHASASQPYWSYQSSAFGTGISQVALQAWAVNAATANDAALVKSTPARVLLVRGAPENAL
ncbi:DUF1566 domain-containing protein [Algibacillus agarilyticus]|uniref:Lcl C-terminal domain-containing protein n=1 Tax=Algibacillus agarilyticus TaxID=2234133 RepID=UPI000DD09C6B|nr:DUF1566 domain-containing protein [Algibacillus agarilyticus]